MSRLVTSVLALVLAGCGTSARTQVMVIVDAEPGVRSEIGELRITVRGGATAGDLSVVETVNLPARDIAWPIELALVPRDADASRRYEVTAVAHDASGAIITNVAARGGYVAERTLALPLLLEDACAGTECDGETCSGGSCQSAEVDASELTDYTPPTRMDGGEHRDAGPLMDGGPSDGGHGDGGTEDGGGPEDGGPDAAIDPDACDPLAQTGCSPGQKCSWNDTEGGERTTCVASGSVSLGGACTRADGTDDCDSGLFCLNGQCAEICGTSPETCDASAVCTLYGGVFTDRSETGFCVPLCDPVAQDCPVSGEACYLNLFEGASTCAAPADPSRSQGESCMYINHCAPGLGCTLNDGVPGEFRCTAFCDLRTGPTCPSRYTCMSPNDVYSDIPEVPAHVGICADCDDFPAGEGC